MCYVWMAILIALFASTARAQEHHTAGHADYSGWSSQKTANCCNNEDCGELEDSQWKSTPQGDQILIKGKWCPVEAKHYTTADGNECERLLCFMGNGGV